MLRIRAFQGPMIPLLVSKRIKPSEWEVNGSPIRPASYKSLLDSRSAGIRLPLYNGGVIDFP